MKEHLEIADIQGEELESAFSGQRVVVSGIVSCVLHRGFYLQTPNAVWDGRRSTAIFVYSPDYKARLGTALRVEGEVTDYLAHETAKPVTQLLYDSHQAHSFEQAHIDPIEFDQTLLTEQGADLARWLNSAEGMLIRIPKGSTFISPSNKFGDYVLHLPGLSQGLVKSSHGGLVLGQANDKTWFPGFRVLNNAHAQMLNVGSILKNDVIGALHHRVNAYQLSVNFPFEFTEKRIVADTSRFSVDTAMMRVMSLNCFNLDPKIEDAANVSNLRTDIDDDWGDGRFHSLAKAIVVNAKEPDVVALQEIQDSDGAEFSDQTDAGGTYALLLKAISKLTVTSYEWVDIAPELDTDGGQPGGNIRNGFLYRIDTVEMLGGTPRRLGEQALPFEDSRKPLVVDFVLKSTQKRVSIVNVHLASKRHQEGAFSPNKPGFDPKDVIRTAQGQIILDEMTRLSAAGDHFYVTGDFNDSEHSATLSLLTSKGAKNLVFTLPENDRYEYNHRGKLQLLMHGLVSESLYQDSIEQFEILHGNELIGVTPGDNSDRASDHAYLLARF